MSNAKERDGERREEETRKAGKEIREGGREEREEEAREGKTFCNFKNEMGCICSH